MSVYEPIKKILEKLERFKLWKILMNIEPLKEKLDEKIAEVE